jgi:uncharacterized membrane protein YbhN (UPF0104 family)
MIGNWRKVPTLKISKKRIGILALQIAVSFVVLYLLFNGINFGQTLEILSKSNLSMALSACVFFVLSSITIALALHHTLLSADVRIPKRSTIFASFGGQLLSDFTPAKSGYFATPALLNKLKAVPIEKGLMSVMAMGAINFFIKASFSAAALLYFLNRFAMDPGMTNAMLTGIGLLLLGAVGLTILVWTNYLPNFLLKLTNTPVIGKVVKKLDSLLKIFSKDQSKLKQSAKTTVPLILGSIFVSTIALLLVARSVGLTQPQFQDLLFMGPLTAVFMYVPITLAGLGLQEAAYVFILTNLGAPFQNALAFALLVRILCTTTDLIGFPSLLKTSQGIIEPFTKDSAKQKEFLTKNSPSKNDDRTN